MYLPNDRRFLLSPYWARVKLRFARARARSYNIVRLSGPPAIPLPRKYEITGQFSFAFRYLCRVIRRRLRYRKMKTKKKNIVDICLDIYIYIGISTRNNKSFGRKRVSTDKTIKRNYLSRINTFLPRLDYRRLKFSVRKLYSQFLQVLFITRINTHIRFLMDQFPHLCITRSRPNRLSRFLFATFFVPASWTT